ncbi:HEPN-associated N-terminal domain-containing protein [Yinghuangia soli]|uniref:RES domain-containing protein n=1 Tax=Yinghuangia soli TaxID=2908204 RepID=A0AA41Q092_9ACTN|nr:HEPN-associated N-terminal domain-containing protein [Yinghuangia soli]MCF2527682.1 RES domain-containing protein [Yinghuangia soli]
MSSGEFVCVRCVGDPGLAAVLRKAVVPGVRCSFCGRVDAAALEVLVAAFTEGVRRDYRDAANGEAGATRSADAHGTADLLAGPFAGALTGPGLSGAVVRALGNHAWVRRDAGAVPRDVALMSSWQSFSHIVRHRIRYVFWKRTAVADAEVLRAGEIPPALILREIGAIIADLGLVRTLAPDEPLWRARVHPAGADVGSAAALGTLPVGLSTRSNRMNPAGIPMFYAADSADTAYQEAVGERGAGTEMTLGAFRVSRPARIVDFTDLPPVPSPFDPQQGHLRRCVAFLHDFVADLGQEVSPRYVEIDYVPTQVVTEFLLHAWDPGQRIDGLAYRSVRTGGVCVVLDVGAEDCVAPDDARLAGPEADGGRLRLVLDPETVRLAAE